MQFEPTSADAAQIWPNPGQIWPKIRSKFGPNPVEIWLLQGDTWPTSGKTWNGGSQTWSKSPRCGRNGATCGQDWTKLNPNRAKCGRSRQDSVDLGKHMTHIDPLTVDIAWISTNPAKHWPKLGQICTTPSSSAEREVIGLESVTILEAHRHKSPSNNPVPHMYLSLCRLPRTSDGHQAIDQQWTNIELTGFSRSPVDRIDHMFSHQIRLRWTIARHTDAAPSRQDVEGQPHALDELGVGPVLNANVWGEPPWPCRTPVPLVHVWYGAGAR